MHSLLASAEPQKHTNMTFENKPANLYWMNEYDTEVRQSEYYVV